MITIVTPTMWKFSPYLEFVRQIIKLDVIYEIIIVNNDTSNTPTDPVLLDPKIKMLDFGRNIYVNPAWNIGVNASKTEIVCILNDDLIFDLRLFNRIAEFMKPEMGAVGLSEGVVEYGQTPITNGIIDFEPFTGQNCYGFGELYFVNKSKWTNIPDGLDVGFGEVFIFEKFYFSGIQNYLITNLPHYHGGSTTMNQLPKQESLDRFHKEQDLYNQLKKDMITNRNN